MSARRNGYRVMVTLAAVLILGVWQLSAAQERPAASGDDAFRAFAARIEAYARLHHRLEERLPPLEANADPMSRLLNRRYLASAIRAARRGATQGDMFTPDVADRLRARLAEILAGRDMSIVTGPRADESWPADVAIVNEPFHEEASRAVPTPFLEALPPLPGDIVYRIVGTDLVLWDVHADIVIDVLPDAFRIPSSV